MIATRMTEVVRWGHGSVHVSVGIIALVAVLILAALFAWVEK